MVMQRWIPRSSLSNWNPFREMEEMGRGFENLFGRSYLPVWWRRFPIMEDGEWMPAIDVFEKDDKFMIKAEIPGMKQDDIDIAVTDSILTINGEKKTESEVKEEDYYKCERTYGRFYRSVQLPSAVNAGKIEANYNDGVLEVSIPKMAEAKPKKVKVTTGKKAIKS
jgi:HSP20 family protein